MDLAQLIQDSASTDNERKLNAEARMREAASQNPGYFISACSQELFITDLPDLLRHRVALIIQNTLQESPNGADELWRSFDQEIRQKIKMNVLATLIYPNDLIRERTAQIISFIFGIEFSLKEWPDLIANLSMNTNNVDIAIRKSAILTLSKVCEELKRRKILIESVTANEILCGIFFGMKDSGADDSIKQISIEALGFILSLNQELFENQDTTREILKALLDSISSKNRDLKICALKSLIEFIKVCRSNLDSEPGVLWEYTAPLIVEDDKELAILAINVWNTIAQEDTQMKMIGKIEQTLVVSLLQNLSNHSNYEGTELNVIGAIKSCLASLARILKEKFLKCSLEFVQAYITSQNPSELIASLIAFSCMLDCPSQGHFSNIVHLILPKILEILLNNTNLKVQEEASSALLKVAEEMPEAYFEEPLFSQMSENLIAAINTHPKVSWRMAKLWHYLGEYLLGQVREKKQIPYDLSIVIDTLVKNSFRDLEKESYVVIDHSLLAASSLLLCIPKEEIRKKYLLDFIQQIRQTKDFDEGRRESLQGGLLLCIQNLLLQSEFRDKNPIIDEIFKLLEEMFQSVGYVESMGIGALCSLISALGPDFEPYFEKSWVWITKAFSRFDQPEFFDVGLNSIESLAIACPSVLERYLGEIFTGLVILLDKPDFNKRSKLRIIGALGDISLGCKDLILPYAETLSRVYEVSMSAAVFNVAEGDSELADYIRNLRIHLLESYTCFFHCIIESSNPNLILTSIPCVMEFLAVTCSQNYHPTQEYLRTALALIADVGLALKDQVKQYIKSELTVYLVESLSKFSNDPDNASIIDYAKTVLKNF